MYSRARARARTHTHTHTHTLSGIWAELNPQMFQEVG